MSKGLLEIGREEIGLGDGLLTRRVIPNTLSVSTKPITSYPENVTTPEIHRVVLTLLTRKMRCLVTGLLYEYVSID